MSTAEPLNRGIDETLVIEQLKLTPEQRLAQLERMYEWGQELARAGARFRGESLRLATTRGAGRPQDLVDVESLEVAREQRGLRS